MSSKIKTVAAIAFCVVAGGSSALAQANLLTNPGFEATTDGSTGQINYNGFGLTGWTSGPVANNYDFVFSGANADSVGANGVNGNVQLWGPNSPTPSANGLGPSPDGGNFVGIEPDFRNNPDAISQTITGLTPGPYTVTFYWAVAQQYGFNDSGTPSSVAPWEVDINNSPVGGGMLNYSLSNQGFSGWMQQGFHINVGTSLTLSFLAVGGFDSTDPRFDLLDGVTLTQDAVPDTSSTAGLMGLGVAAMGIAARGRRLFRT